jgi:hypothetical protein
MPHSKELGSKTAKDGFKNEDFVVDKFNNWKNDPHAQNWLNILGYKLDEIEYVLAIKLSGFKTDVQVQVSIKLRNAIDAQNIQVKLVSNPNGFNQIDKRWINSYAELWEIPAEVVDILKRFTGELPPSANNLRDKKKRRMFIDEFTEEEQHRLLKWLKSNRLLIVSDILKGRGEFAAEWILVIQRLKQEIKFTLKPMNFCLNFFGNGDILITPRGSIKIGKITMQRKGGDAGRKTADMLQFKINPSLLIE